MASIFYYKVVQCYTKAVYNVLSVARDEYMNNSGPFCSVERQSYRNVEIAKNI